VSYEVCSFLDCPYHPKNEFRKKMMSRLMYKIKSFEKRAMDVYFFKDIFAPINNLYELESVPRECLICSHFVKRDMRLESISQSAKKELLNEDLQ